jgi:hypothetical protein
MTTQSTTTYEQLQPDRTWKKEVHHGYGSYWAIRFANWITKHYKDRRNQTITYTKKPTTLKDLFSISQALEKND